MMQAFPIITLWPTLNSKHSSILCTGIQKAKRIEANILLRTVRLVIAVATWTILSILVCSPITVSLQLHVVNVVRKNSAVSHRHRETERLQ